MAFDLDDEELEMTRVHINKLPPKRKIQIGDRFRTTDGIYDVVLDFNCNPNRYFNVHGISGRDYTDDEIVAYDEDILNIIRTHDIVNGSKVVKINCREQFIKDNNTEDLLFVTNGIQLESGIAIYFEDDIENVMSYEKYIEGSLKRYGGVKNEEI